MKMLAPPNVFPAGRYFSPQRRTIYMTESLTYSSILNLLDYVILLRYIATFVPILFLRL